jgi:diguanylate cyclase (GGDEF)-like protein
MGTTTTVVVAAAGAAALVLAIAAFLTARARARRDHRLQAVLSRIGDNMDVLSQSLLAVVESAEEARAPGVELGLTLDLGEVLQETARTASRLVGADGAGITVSRERGEPATAVYGLGVARADQPGVEPPDQATWRSAIVQWAPARGSAEDAIRSALAVPLHHDGGRLGTLTVYARSARSFSEEHSTALTALAAEAVPAIVNARLHEATVELVRTDSLTGFRNRQGYDEALQLEIARARRAGRPLTVVLLDLDRFHDVNARFGYQVGDAVLVEFTELVASVSRASDVLCRRGGEEFVVLLPDTECRDGIRFDLRLRTAVETAVFATGAAISYSAGLTELRDGDDAASIDERIGRMALAAKEDGRNRLVHDCTLHNPQ